MVTLSKSDDHGLGRQEMSVCEEQLFLVESREEDISLGRRGLKGTNSSIYCISRAIGTKKVLVYTVEGQTYKDGRRTVDGRSV